MEESTMKKRLFALGALSVLAVVAAFVAQPGARAATTPTCVNTAPTGTQYVGSVTVDSASSTPTTPLSLPANGTYTAVACGTWMNGIVGQWGYADAAFNSPDSSWATHNQGGGPPYNDPNWGILQINGQTPNWGAYSADHTYQTQFTGASASFLIPDAEPGAVDWYYDNFGSLTVDVYRVNTAPTSDMQCKNNGWKAYGVFKNQGDCVSFVATGAKNLPAGA
jgi:hypothetical protein